MSYQPVNGNQGFSLVRKTVVPPSALYNIHEEGRFTQLREIQGYVCPTTNDTPEPEYYALLDSAGHPLTIPAGSLVDSVSFGAYPFGTLNSPSLNASLELSIVETPESDPTTGFVLASTTVALANQNVMVAPSTVVGLPAGYLIVTAVGDFQKVGECEGCYQPKACVVIKYMDPHDINRKGIKGFKTVSDRLV